MSSTSSPPTQAVRRRASRAAGPTGGTAEIATVRIEKGGDDNARLPKGRLVGPPPRRPAHRRLVAVCALAFAFAACAAVAAPVAVMMVQEQHADAAQARNQRFVDTATQMAVNMYSFTQDTIDEQVNAMVNGSSGPLHDTFASGNNADFLKKLFQQIGGSSEAVVSGAAMEGSIDPVSDNASVLVALRITPSDMNGNNQPSRARRIRLIVHEDENGRMTTYDLKFPNGGT